MSLPFLNGQYKIEIVPVKVMNQVLVAQDMLQAPNGKSFSRRKVLMSCFKLPDWNVLHPALITQMYGK